MRVKRPVIVLAVLVLAAGVGLGLAATALAADGTRVIPTPLASPDYGQREPSVSADMLAYSSCLPGLGQDDDQVIRLKFLWDDSAPQAIPRPDGYKDMEPAILVDGPTIYVVWTRLRLANGASHLMIWKGAYGSSGAAAGLQFIPNPGYPTQLVTGTAYNAAAVQSAPAIGLVTIGAEQHVVVAWEDTRQTYPETPEIYWADLTTEPVSDPASVGIAADSTGVLGRGQHLPAVGPDGIYWLDERLSWWDDGNLTDTAIWKLDVSAAVAAPYFKDSGHEFDNGLDEAPQSTWNGAAWLRQGAYAGAGALPYLKPAGGGGQTLGPLIRPFDLSAHTREGASTSGVAVAAMHGDRLDAVDADIFFFDTATGQRIAVCNRGNPAGTDPETHPDYYTLNQMSPVVGNAPDGYRVIWVDQRESLGEDTPDAKLYEAFVPVVTWSLRQTSIINFKALQTTVTVRPDFTGEAVKLQRVTPVKSPMGFTQYTPVGRSYLATATMVAGKDQHSSVATLKWTPRAKGTYYLRVWFAGGTKYSYSGSGEAAAGAVKVPHVGNYSKVLKVTVK